MSTTAAPVTGERLTAEQVYRDHLPRVYHLARRMLGNDADAEDVTQDVLLQVVRKLDTFRGDASITTWLHRVTVNAALAFRRKKANRHEQQSDDYYDQTFPDGPHPGQVRSWQVRPDEELESRETRELVEQAIAGLPPVYRDVYLLADVEQLPNAEIADVLKMSVAAVKSRLHRARLLMRHALAKHFEEVPA